MDAGYLQQIGALVRDARTQRNLTQQQLALALRTSQSAIARIEQGRQNVSLEILARIGAALDTGLVQLGSTAGPTHLRVVGGRQLSGSIEVKSSKNAAVALLCACLLNDGTTVLRGVARIEEVNRILEVLRSVGVAATWIGDSDLELRPPATLDLEHLDQAAARRTRSVLLLLGPLLHRTPSFAIPYAGGCQLGTRTVEPHKSALRPFGVKIVATEGSYQVDRDTGVVPPGPVVLTERGDTVTENAVMAAARLDQVTVIRNASSNYMVQDLCFYLEQLGVRVEGVGSTTLTVHGRSHINVDVEYAPAEDPIEAMSLLTAAIVTGSEIEVCRVPIEFLEIELAVLEEMGFEHARTKEYAALNGRTRLVDITTKPSALHAPLDKVHPMPFPGLNIDNIRSSPSSPPSRRGARSSTTGCMRTARSTSPSSTDWAARSRCWTRTGSGSTARRTGRRPRSSARRRCVPRWSCCWPCSPPRGRRSCDTSTSSTEAMRTSRPGCPPSARASSRSATSEPARLRTAAGSRRSARPAPPPSGRCGATGRTATRRPRRRRRGRRWPARATTGHRARDATAALPIRSTGPAGGRGRCG